MIISASRRTDIPAFYPRWLINRLEAGEALVRSPFNSRKLSRVILNPETVDCMVLWSKNPRPLFPYLSRIPYPFYIQFTLNPYGPPLEPDLPTLDRRIETFRELSRMVGRHRIIWRYDPIVLSPATSCTYHLDQFDRLSRRLAPYTEKCIISFMDDYAKIRRPLSPLSVREAGPDEMESIARGFAALAAEQDLIVESCCEPAMADWGIRPGRCIDDVLIGRILGRPLAIPPDRGQRKACGCVESIDIGAYDTCGYGCLYCYANRTKQAENNRTRHDPASPLLIGFPDPKLDIISDRAMHKYQSREEQTAFPQAETEYSSR